MAHTFTFLDCKTNAETGVAELVYEFDGHIDSMAFDSVAAIADAAESGDVIQTGTQALMIVMAFWSAREDFDRNISKMLGQQVEIDFHAPAQVPQVRFALP
jgi:hypothetical protein